MRLIPILFLPALLMSQEIKDSSFRAPNGERVQCLEIVVPATLQQAWEAVSSSQGWMSWMAPAVDLELKPLGRFNSNYRAGSKPGDPGTIYNTVLAYVPLRMFSMKIGLNENFPKEVREANSLFSVLTLEEAGPGRVKLSEMMVGWQEGPAWDQAWGFFDKGNRYTLQQLYKRLTQGPTDWKAPATP
jgi:hypothetical protein